MARCMWSEGELFASDEAEQFCSFLIELLNIRCANLFDRQYRKKIILNQKEISCCCSCCWQLEKKKGIRGEMLQKGDFFTAEREVT